MVEKWQRMLAAKRNNLAILSKDEVLRTKLLWQDKMLALTNVRNHLLDIILPACRQRERLIEEIQWRQCQPIEKWSDFVWTPNACFSSTLVKVMTESDARFDKGGEDLQNQLVCDYIFTSEAHQFDMETGVVCERIVERLQALCLVLNIEWFEESGKKSEKNRLLVAILREKLLPDPLNPSVRTMNDVKLLAKLYGLPSFWINLWSGVSVENADYIIEENENKIIGISAEMLRCVGVDHMRRLGVSSVSLFENLANRQEFDFLDPGSLMQELRWDEMRRLMAAMVSAKKPVIRLLSKKSGEIIHAASYGECFVRGLIWLLYDHVPTRGMINKWLRLEGWLPVLAEVLGRQEGSFIELFHYYWLHTGQDMYEFAKIVGYVFKELYGKYVGVAVEEDLLRYLHRCPIGRREEDRSEV